jgi:hypothetical protein
MRAGVKTFYKILLVLLVIGIAFFAVSCSINIEYADPKVASVSVYSLSKVDGYVAGDDLDIHGAKILVVYDNGEKEILDLTKEMIDFGKLNMSDAEEQKTVTVVYGGVETTFVISVDRWNFNKVELTTLPNKTTYIEGETVETKGAELSIYYDGGNVVKRVVSKDMLESYSNSVGKRNIKINYFGVDDLVFEVEFLKRTAVKIEILREPEQVSVFQNYGDRLARDGMKIEITYDNKVAEVYENAIIKSDSNAELVAKERNKWKDIIENNLYIDIPDWDIASSVEALAAYKQPGLEEIIEYKFQGTAKVKEGDIVDVNTRLATTVFQEDIISKSAGVVTQVSPSKIVVSRNIDYRCNVLASRGNYKKLQVGNLLEAGSLIGKYGFNDVFSQIDGIVSKIDNGIVTVTAIPVEKFSIGVTDKEYHSMEIVKFPVTKTYATAIDRANIIQGDTINFDTGIVKVTFNNGETKNYVMSDANFIRIKNHSNNLRKEIEGFNILNAEGTVTNVPAGENYELPYSFSYDNVNYPLESLKTIVSVLDDIGNINVSNNRTIVPEAAKNYRVSIVVTYTDITGKTFVTEASYMIATVGAPALDDRLDISGAGNHTLRVIYAGDADSYIELDVFVEQKVPVRIIIDENTNNIGQREFYRGDSLPFSTIKYILEYSNGERDLISTGVTKNMVISKSEDINDELVCTEIGANQYIEISMPNSSIESQKLYFRVIPLPIVALTVIEEPKDAFLTGKGITNGGTAGATAIDLTGASLLVSYLKGTTQELKDDGNNGYLIRLFNNGKNDLLPNIKIAYNPVDDAKLTEEEIFGEQKKSYIAILTYTDIFGETATAEMEYYIVTRKPKSIKVTVEQATAEWHYKYDYVQCENWDFTGMSIIASYEGEAGSTITENVPLKPYMVYKTDTDSVGNEIPLIIRYFGILEESPSVHFNVRERQETGVIMTRTGKINYVTTGVGLDLSDYVFAITFNAGTKQAINGIYAFIGSVTKSGWWYEVYDAEVPQGKTEPEPVLDNYGRLIRSNMRVTGDKMIRLYHTSELEFKDEYGRTQYNINYVDFYVKVDIREAKIVGIVFEDTTEYASTTPVLGKVAAGMPLVYTYYDTINSVLKERLLTILYEDGEKGWIELTNKDVNIDYEIDNITLGFRTVNVKYDVFSCILFVEVIDAKLVDISLVNAPKTNYINREEFSIDGGVLRATYKENNSDLLFSVYVLMNSKTELLENDEVDCIIPYYDEKGEYIDYITKTIRIYYGTKTNNASTNYIITIYNPQDVTFTYSDVIFFYGNTTDATVKAHQQIDGFVLPTEDDPKTPEDERNPDAIKKYYVSNEFFQYMTPEEYEIAKLSNPNLIPIVLWNQDTKTESIVYYDLDDVCKYKNSPSRPYVPATKGYSYYILMMVEGNTYYRTRNYCRQIYTIIPKVIEVNVINANENAFVYRVFTTDNPTAIKALYNDINSINSNWTSQYSFIQKIELASPNKDYFEILMTVTTDYNDSNYAQVTSIFNSINGQIQNYQKDGVKVSVINTITLNGVNVAEYNGKQPDYVTYTVASGETLTYQNVLDLLEGKLEIEFAKDEQGRVIYGVGDYAINNDNDTLCHNNYNISILTTSDPVFRVTKNIIEEIIVEGNEASDWQYITFGKTLTINQGDEIIAYAINIAENINRKINDYEIRYYLDEACQQEVVGDLVAREELYYGQLDTGYYLYFDDAEQAYKDYEFSFKIKVNK